MHGELLYKNKNVYGIGISVIGHITIVLLNLNNEPLGGQK